MAKSNEAKPFKIDDMQTAFYILFIGLVISTFVFIGELLVYNRKQQQQQPFEFVH